MSHLCKKVVFKENIIYKIRRDQNAFFSNEGNDETWNHIGFGDTFTEEDVSENRFRYQHTSVIGTKAQVIILCI